MGSRVPLASSATGWAYIAGLDDAEREQVFEAIRPTVGKNWPALLGKIRKALASYEKTGYVVNLGSLHARINAVAVPLWSADGSALLSLSSGGISDLFDASRLQQVGAELKELAAKLAPALRATGGVR